MDAQKRSQMGGHDFLSEEAKTKGKELLARTRENIEHFRKGDAEIKFTDANGKPLQNLVVKIIQKTQDFLFGNLLFDLVRVDQPYKPGLFQERFLELFNFAIFPFYWPFYEKAPGMTEWEKFIPALEWCNAHGVTAKGHPLVWPYSAGIPEWLYDMPEKSCQDLAKIRVINIVKGFAPYIGIWDVTNEAINHISWKEATQPDFRARYHDIDIWRGIQVSSSFKREIPISEAADWVEKSFVWAYTANPRATLIVNDYNQEYDPHVRQRFYDFVIELKKRNVPVSGLGLQMHPVNHWLWPQQIWETLEIYSELDCPIHITELHQPSSDQQIEGAWQKGTWTLEAQAEYIEQIYRLCFAHPSIFSINYWGLSDRNIWIKGGGLIDEEYRPKPVYETLKRLIKGEWITMPIQTRTDEDGKIKFRGFYGKYDLVLQQADKQHSSFQIDLNKKQLNNWQFIIGS